MAKFKVVKNKDYTVMSNVHLRDTRLTLKAKGLMSIILSLPDDWDYSTRGLAAICKEGVDAIGTALKELEKCGYILRKIIRDNHGRIADTEYTIYETPQDPDTLPHDRRRTSKKAAKSPYTENPDTVKSDTEVPYTENPDTVNPDTVNPDTDKPYTAKPYPENPAQLNTKELNKEELNIDQSIYPKQGSSLDSIDEIELYSEIVKDNIGYSQLRDTYGRDRVDSLLSLLTDTLIGKKPYIRIGGADYPYEVVKSRLLKLDEDTVSYVFDCMDNNTSEIRNIRSYLLTSLFNAPTTIDSYYQAAVRRDGRKDYS